MPGYNSPPPKFLLYRLAEKFFGVNTAALAEPIVSTFSRGLVDFQNNLVFSLAQIQVLQTLANGGGGGATGGLFLTFPIPANAGQITVTGLGLPFFPTRCIPTVMKNTGDQNFTAHVLQDTLTPDGFTADLSGVTDNANYVLAFTIT